jgi:multidrug efflux system outer membrane protein
MRQLLQPTLRLSLLTGSALVVLIFAGCKVGPDYHRPEVSVPAEWAGPTALGAGTTRPSTRPTTGPVAATTRPVDLTVWWEGFSDPVLTGLVREATEANLTIRQAASRVRQARASRTVSRSALFPDVNTNGSYSRTGSGRDSNLGSNNDLYRAGLDASWELDVFGGVRRSVEQADAEVSFAVEDERDVRVSLAAEVALNYVDLRSFQRDIEISRSNLEAQQRSAGLTRRQFQGGFVSALDVTNAEAQVASTESQIPALEANARQAIYALSVLLAREPAALLNELTAQRGVLGSPPEVPVGLPSELLQRRPDIRRADARLHAATARIGVATADLYPKFSITAALGLQSEQFKHLADWSSRFWNIAPGVSWSVLDAGRIRANIDVQTERERQALYAYQRDILTALEEVENALTAYGKERSRRVLLREAVERDRRAVELANTLYQGGARDFLNVIDAERALASAEDALVQSDRLIATNLVALYKALGGGWEEEGR